ncbi:MAG: hypothetical protein BECKG1743F_GA0114225_104221, partial [Candidatus Kentron sp. G]
QLRATMSAIRHPCLIVGRCPSNFEGRNTVSKVFYDWIKKARIALPEVHVIINERSNQRILSKPLKIENYPTAQQVQQSKNTRQQIGGDVHVKGLRFFPEDATNDSPFWIWYADTNCPGIIGDDSVAGFRLRKSNIAIGFSERMTDVFRDASESYARFNRYFIGEVHIQDQGVIPNAHRDDFEKTDEWLDIREQLIEFARERSREAYALSEGRNADIEKLISIADRQIEKIARKQRTGVVSKAERIKLDANIEKYIGKIEAAEKADRPEEERERLGKKRKELQLTKGRIAEIKFTAGGLDTSQGNRMIISQIGNNIKTIDISTLLSNNSER